MYKYFYITMLLSAILLGLITLVSSMIDRRPTKVWRCIYFSLVVIIVVMLIGFIITLTLER